MEKETGCLSILCYAQIKKTRNCKFRDHFQQYVAGKASLSGAVTSATTTMAGPTIKQTKLAPDAKNNQNLKDPCTMAKSSVGVISAPGKNKNHQTDDLCQIGIILKLKIQIDANDATKKKIEQPREPEVHKRNHTI
jgi:hypothetical protein